MKHPGLLTSVTGSAANGIKLRETERLEYLLQNIKEMFLTLRSNIYSEMKRLAQEGRNWRSPHKTTQSTDDKKKYFSSCILNVVLWQRM